MKIYASDGTEIMSVAKIERAGPSIKIQGTIMGAMPMTAILRPEEARKGLRLLSGRMLLFLITFLFRSSR